MGVASVSTKHEKVPRLLTPFLNRMAKSDGFCLPADIGNDSRVLIIDSGDLTEILFFSPVLQQLKRRFPGMRVTYLVREGNSELVRTMSQISEMITYEPAHLALSSTTYFRLIKRVREREFDVAFLPGTEFNMARSVLAMASGAKIRVGFASEGSYPFVNCEVRVRSQTAYEGSKAHNFLTLFGLNAKENLKGWTLPEQDQRWAKQMIHFHKPAKDTLLIAVDPGIGKGRHRLVDESFTYLVNKLSNRVKCRILVVSNNLGKKHLKSFVSSIRGGTLDIDATNVKEGLALLSCADLLLSGNTDFFHFAVSMGTPTIGLFTRHDTDNWFPKTAKCVQIIQGVKGQRLSLEEFNSKIDTLLHLTRVE